MKMNMPVQKKTSGAFLVFWVIKNPLLMTKSTEATERERERGRMRRGRAS